MAKEKKLTIKHFYGEDLKKVNNKTDNLFPLYVQISYNRKTTRITSFSLSAARIITAVNLATTENKYGERDNLTKSVNLLFEGEEKSGYEGFIAHDKKIIQNLKSIYENHFSKEFDVSFFSSELCKNLTLPCDIFINEKLQDFITDFLHERNLKVTERFVKMLEPPYVREFIHTISDNNPKLFEEILHNEVLRFFYFIKEVLNVQRMIGDNKFYFLFDALDNELLASIEESSKRVFDDPRFLADIKKHLAAHFLGEIYFLINSFKSNL